MPAHAVPLGSERFSACEEGGEVGSGGDGDDDASRADDAPDFTVFLTRPCLSIDEVGTRYIYNYYNSDDKHGMILEVLFY